MNTCLHHNDAERSGAGCPVCARAEVERLKAELVEVAKVAINTINLTNERIAVLTAELERTERAAAEMREALEMCSQVCDEMATIAWDENSDVDGETFSALQERVNRALSSPIGLGYIKAETLTCIQCHDGNTALFCLNCARQGYVRASEFSDTITTLEDLAECFCQEHAKEAQNELARLTALVKGASK